MLQKIQRLMHGLQQRVPFRLDALFSLTSILAVICLLLFIALSVVWHNNVIPAERALYTPFQNSISFIRYIGLILGCNVAIALLSFRKNTMWAYLPLFTSLMLLLLAGFYMLATLKN